MTQVELREVTAVVFDVGEVLIDETTEYGAWADWLGVPRHTFSAMFGAVIARGGDYRQVFQHFRPGFDLARERQKRLDAGLGEFFNARDLYPDVRPCLTALKDAGYVVGIAGNQTRRAGGLLRELNLPADFIVTWAAITSMASCRYRYAVAIEILASRARIRRSVRSLNHRSTRTAWTYGVAARCHGRASWVLRCAASQRDTTPTVEAGTSRVAR